MSRKCALCDHEFEPYQNNFGQLFCSISCRFWSKVNKRGTEECWPFLGSHNRKGYGQFILGGRCWHASRVAYQLTYNVTLHEEQFVCHRCDNPSCANPAHLFLGTLRENFRDMFDKGRQQMGSAHYAALLEESQIIEIKKLLAEGLTAPQVASRYKVSKWTIYNIKQNRNWKQVQPSLG